MNKQYFHISYLDNFPSHSTHCVESFQKLNPKWQGALFDEIGCDSFIQSNLPHLYELYSRSSRDMQLNIIRCGILYTTGGVYSDLDIECILPIDDLIHSARASGIIRNDTEVLIARDHPVHERKQNAGRALYTSEFMIALKPGALLLTRCLDRIHEMSVEKLKKIGDLTCAPGRHMLNEIIEDAGGLDELGIGILPWQWVHPLPDMSLDFDEWEQYDQLIRNGKWYSDVKIFPFVVCYWHHDHEMYDSMKRIYGERLFQRTPLLLEKSQSVLEFGAIPKIIHRFELGDDRGHLLTKESAYSWISANVSEGWEYKAWDDSSIDRYLLDKIPEAGNFVENEVCQPLKRLIASCLILYEYGGVFVGNETVCLKPLKDWLPNASLVFSCSGRVTKGRSDISGAFMASAPRHPFWDGIDRELNEENIDSYRDAIAIDAFLTRRVVESIDIISKDTLVIRSDLIFPIELSHSIGVLGKSELTIGNLSDKYPNALAVVLVDESDVKKCLSFKIDSFAKSNQEDDCLIWEDVYSIVGDEIIDSYYTEAGESERELIDSYFEIEAIENRGDFKSIFSVSLFWKNVDISAPELPTPTLDRLINAVDYGLARRFDPWLHYCKPLIDGAAGLRRAGNGELGVRVYLAKDLDFLTNALVGSGCEVVLMKSSSIRACPGMMWRFLALENIQNQIAVIDSDQMLNPWVQLILLNRFDVDLDFVNFGFWRSLAPTNDIDKDGTLIYRPIGGTNLGARESISNIRELMKAFIWMSEQGRISTKAIHPLHGKLPIFGTTWPGYGFDEWFLHCILYPKIAAAGCATVNTNNGHSRLFSLDMDFMKRKNPISKEFQLGELAKWYRCSDRRLDLPFR